MMTKTIGLFLIWLLLSQQYDVFHVVLGLVVAIGVAWFNADSSVSRRSASRWRVVLYFPWLLVRILQSGVHLSVLILHPKLPIDPKLIEYRTRLQDEGGIVLLGNSITLTPGTITVELNSNDLVVHAMDDESASDVTDHRIERKIALALGERTAR